MENLGDLLLNVYVLLLLYYVSYKFVWFLFNSVMWFMIIDWDVGKFFVIKI